jgi:hypothetical protein
MEAVQDIRILRMLGPASLCPPVIWLENGEVAGGSAQVKRS